MDSRVQIVAILATGAMFLVVLELVRRRRLMERYALLWLFSAAVLLCLSIFRSLLQAIADAVGVAYAPSALFVIAFGFVLLLLLHFSLVISRLADQSKVLAQRLGIVQEQLDRLQEAQRASAEAADHERETALHS
jgi:hypothetical protein